MGFYLRLENESLGPRCAEADLSDGCLHRARRQGEGTGDHSEGNCGLQLGEEPHDQCCQDQTRRREGKEVEADRAAEEDPHLHPDQPAETQGPQTQVSVSLTPFFFRSRKKISTTYAIVLFFSRPFHENFKFLKNCPYDFHEILHSHSTPKGAPACAKASKSYGWDVRNIAKKQPFFDF